MGSKEEPGMSWVGRAAAIGALAMAAGILLFLAFDYLHDPTDPWERISWTFPRVSQFWTYKQDDYLKGPAYDRNSPPCKFCD